MKTRWAVFGILAALGTTACGRIDDLGTECVLVRKDPNDTNPADGTSSIPIKMSEVTPGKDFISFGATECENLICVRDANAPVGTDPNAVATGICTRPCVPTSEGSCDTGLSWVDDSEQAYSCKALLLDQDSLAAMREQDPEKYQRYFGTTTSPDYCSGQVLE